MTVTEVKDDNNENDDKHAECMRISWVEIDEKTDKKKKEIKISINLQESEVKTDSYRQTDD